MKGINKYFYIIVISTIVILSIESFIGFKQVSDRKIDYDIAKNSITNIKSKTDLEKSIKDLDDIESKYGDIYIVHLNKADAYFNLKKYDKSIDELNECFIAAPEVKNNAKLVYLYGKIEYLNGNLKSSKEAIEKAKELGILETDINQEDLKFIEEVTKE